MLLVIHLAFYGEKTLLETGNLKTAQLIGWVATSEVQAAPSYFL